MTPAVAATRQDGRLGDPALYFGAIYIPPNVTEAGADPAWCEYDAGAPAPCAQPVTTGCTTTTSGRDGGVTFTRECPTDGGPDGSAACWCTRNGAAYELMTTTATCGSSAAISVCTSGSCQ